MVDANSDLSSQKPGFTTLTGGADPLSSLYKMSTTAGLGSQEYVAVNVMSVVTAVIGLASGLVFLDNVLLIIPVAGVVCGMMAVAQIRRSGGTQTGRIWAWLGLILCVGLAGYKFTNEAIAASKTRVDEQRIEQMIVEIGQQVGNPATIGQSYAHFSAEFQKRVPPDFFDARWKSLSAREFLGELRTLKSNGIIRVEPEANTGVMVGVTGVIFGYEKYPDSADRRNFFFRKGADGWKVESIPDLFPSESPPAQ